MKSFFTIFVFTVMFFVSTFGVSFAQVNWTKYQGNPVLQPGSPGAWDDSNVSLVCVILVGDTLHMWYDGNWDNPGTMNSGVGHATSVDGINWSKDILNPVQLPGQPGRWDSDGVSQVTVLYNDSDSLFHMWYQGWDSGQYISIGHATSSDGSHWTKDTSNNPVLSPGSNGSWDDLYILAPCVILVDTTYHMWYEGWKNGSDSIRIGHATSPNPNGTWTKDPTNPVLNPGNSNFWDYPAVGFPNVILATDTLRMFYTGRNWAWGIGYAYSLNGSNWTKYSDHPVLEKGPSGSWDDDFVMRASVMKVAATDSLKMWYSGADNGPNDQVGYATAPMPTTGIEYDDNTKIPNEYLLSQNYPNPFNPSTTIEFSIAKSAFVTLKIYNLLGQKITTLISDKLNAGSYNYSWDGGKLASGIYLYKLQTEDFTETRKMILLR